MVAFQKGKKLVRPPLSQRSSEHGGLSARRRRHRLGFWLDWAPMIGLGLAIAISGVHCIGTSLFANHGATALSLHAHRSINTTVAAKMPHYRPGVPNTGRAAS